MKVTVDPSFTLVTSGATAYVAVKEVSLIVIVGVVATIFPVILSVLISTSNVSTPSVVASAEVVNVIVAVLFTVVTVPLSGVVKSAASTVPERPLSV